MEHLAVSMHRCRIKLVDNQHVIGVKQHHHPPVLHPRVQGAFTCLVSYTVFSNQRPGFAVALRCDFPSTVTVLCDSVPWK